LNIYLVFQTKWIDCTPIHPNVSNTTILKEIVDNSTTVSADILSGNIRRVLIGGKIQKIKPKYNYSGEYGRTVIIDVRIN